MIIGAFALAMVSAGVYGMLNVNLIQANQSNQDAARIPDYTAQLDSLNTKVNSISSQVDSLKSQVNSINSEVNSISSNLTSLNMLKTNIADIHEKLADLQSLNTNISTIQNNLTSIANKTTQTPTYGKILVSLDKSIYAPGDTVHINAVGATPLKTTQVQLLDSSGFALMGQTTWADSTGSILYGLQLSSSILPGQYQVKLASDQITGSQPITVSASTTSSGSYTFTAQTDKTSYKRGDLVQIAGLAQPSSTINAVFASPSGTMYNTSAVANSNGNYVMFFSTVQSYATGTWYAEVSNQGQTKVLSFILQ